jgi:prolyl-tRNA synthetase
MVCRRDQPHKEKQKIAVDALPGKALEFLSDMQANYFNTAKAFRDAHICRDVKTFAEMKEFFTPKNADKPEIHGGFVHAKWCGDAETEKMLDELKVTIRCLPVEQSGTEGTCVLTGRKATIDAVFAKSY